MTVTLTVPSEIEQELHARLAFPVETAGVLLASVVPGSDGTIRVLGRGIHWVPDAAYSRREFDGMTISSAGYIPPLADAERLGATPLWVHTHPGLEALPYPSKHDEKVDREIADVFRLRSGSPYYGALIFSPRAEGFAFTGYIQREGETRAQIDRMIAVGDRFRMTRSANLPPHVTSGIFDRSVRALGGAVQHALGELHVGVVGCGGTGSAVAEQLVRLGVRHMTLVDPDHLSESNVTRVYGSTMGDVGRPKVNVLSTHLKRVAPELRCELIQAMVTTTEPARRLSTCDLIFGCTDDNAGRLVLSRLATYMLIPVIDCGVLLTSDSNDQLTGIDGRITTLAPGLACLVCRDRVDLRQASAELLTPEERKRREDEGYAPALGRTEPAVVPFTTLVAATAVSEILERLIGYGPTPRPSEVLLRCHDREISTNLAQPRPGHYCHPASGKLGVGITEPFLEQTWPN